VDSVKGNPGGLEKKASFVIGQLENLRDLFFWSHCLACGAKNLDLTGVGITIWGTWRGIVPAVQYKAVWRVYNK
jgi:hypothetical protein